MKYSIHHLPQEERPRERLMRYGPDVMTTSDLLAIVLGSGTRGKSVIELAQEIVMHFGGLKKVSEATVEELCQIKGLGLAKAIQLKAAFALSLRLSRQVSDYKCCIEHPLHVYQLVREELENEKRELVLVVLQDVKGCVITHQVVTIGTLSNSLIHPREVFYPAIRHKAATVILVHNHPSGDPTPSKQDIEVTKHLIKVGELLGIPLNDHLIIGDKKFISLRQQGLKFNS
jgi:DNA repair protein RadC